VASAALHAPTPPIIELAAVHKHYRTERVDVHALRGIDLCIEEGEYLTVMGPSGSGKTTLLEILGCLSRPTDGGYRLKGLAVAALDGNDLARVRGEEIGFVFQAFNLLPRLTVVENVELPLAYRKVGRKERAERAMEVLDRVGLAGRARHLPSEISGGERQRVAVARALVNRPSLLLADEPTGNLDTRTGEGVLELFDRVHDDGNTLVIVTHDPRIGARAPRRIRIQDGCLERDERGTA
jgi:putative ABC transport system ATP-binding protein